MAHARNREKRIRTVRRAIAFFAIAFAIIWLGKPDTALAQTAYSPTRFSVEVLGEGPDVIFIPGLSSSREVFRSNAQMLESDYRVHLVQVKGFGGEPAGPNADGPVLDPLVEELARYIEAETNKPAIVGHSLGGLIALMIGADHPGLPGRLLIVDSLPWYGAAVAGPGASPELIEPQAKMMRDAMAAAHGTPQAAQATESAIASYVVDRSKLPVLREWTADADLRVSGQLAYEDLMADYRERIADITVSIGMIYPWNDTATTKDQAEAFYRAQYAAQPDTAFIDIGPAGHFLMADKPEAFQTVLEAFLAG